MKRSRTRSRMEPVGGAAGQRLLEAWTSPAGTEVFVTRDDGIEYLTKTRSAAWIPSPSHPSILLEGISGGFALSRVRLATGVRRVHLASPSRARFDADPGCNAKMTSRDTLTADLERVNCKRCLRALERAGKKLARVIEVLGDHGSATDTLDGVALEHGERVRLTWPDGSTTHNRIDLVRIEIEETLPERVIWCAMVRYSVRGIEHRGRLSAGKIGVERLATKKAPRVERAEE